MKIIFKNDFGPMNMDWVNTGFWNGCNAIILNNQKEICIVKTKDGDDGQPSRWMLPGGGKENGESPEDCVKREIMEEAQLEVENLEYIMTGWGEMYDENDLKISDPEITKGNRPQFRFICKIKPESLQEFIPEKNANNFICEIIERKFVTIDELPNYITWLNNGSNGTEFYEYLKDKILAL